MNIKKLTEEKNNKTTQMLELLNTVETEVRAFTEEEEKRFNQLKGEIEAINTTIKAFEDGRKLVVDKENQANVRSQVSEERALEVEQRDISDFATFIRNNVLSERAEENNFSQGTNGVIIPTTIADKIITTARNMSPILEKATRYNTKGNLEIPVYGQTEDGKDITVSYSEDFKDLVESAGAFTSVTLKDYLIGSLAKIGDSLVNNTDVDLVNAVINTIAEYIKFFLEKEALKGTEGKITGCSDIMEKQTHKTTGASMTYDDLVKTKNKVVQAFRKGSLWVGSQNTQTELELMKDANDRPLFQPDPSGEFDGMVLGYPFYVSDNMDDIATGKTALIFGNFSGLALKTTKDLEIKVLKEKYATQHATGVLAWLEADIKVEHHQKLSKLVIGE